MSVVSCRRVDDKNTRNHFEFPSKSAFRMGFGWVWEQIHHITQVYCSFSVSARGINELRFLHKSRLSFRSPRYHCVFNLAASFFSSRFLFYGRTNNFWFQFSIQINKCARIRVKRVEWGLSISDVSGRHLARSAWDFSTASSCSALTSVG